MNRLSEYEMEGLKTQIKFGQHEIHVHKFAHSRWVAIHIARLKKMDLDNVASIYHQFYEEDGQYLTKKGDR